MLGAAQRGDEAAFVTLFRSVQPMLIRYLHTLAPELADDVASETWVAVVRGLARFQGEEAGFRAWVFAIARARLSDARRAAARRPLVADDEVLARHPADLDVSTEVEEIMSTEQALALLRRLPPDQAEAVFLRHVAGLDVQGTAEVLGKRAGAVRVATHRGLKRLAAWLADEQERADGQAVADGLGSGGKPPTSAARSASRAWRATPPGSNASRPVIG